MRGIKPSAHFPPLPPSHRPALTTTLPSQDGASAPGTGGPHTCPWVKARSSKRAAALQDCSVGLGGLGLGDIGLAARSRFRHLSSSHASPSQGCKHCKPMVWRPSCRSGRGCVWGQALGGKRVQKKGGGKGDGMEEAGFKMTSMKWFGKTDLVELSG